MSIPDALLAQRFGFGPRAGQLPARKPGDQLAQPDRMVKEFAAPDTRAVLEQAAEWRAQMRAQKDDTKAGVEGRRAVRQEAAVWTMRNARTELARAVSGDDGFRERLVRFWADHFTVRIENVIERGLVTAMADDAIRPNLTAPFARMLRAAVLHPAMLGFLNQTASTGPDSPVGQRKSVGLNENLARELLELHTLGVDGGYTQHDVRQTALLLTGLVVAGPEGTAFQPRRAEPGAETVLGRSYGGGNAGRIEDIHQLLDDLAAHPSTARHICGKLAVHFVSDTPEPVLVNDLVAVWSKTDGDLKAVCRALADHPAALRPVLEKARQPLDFIVAGLRALGVTGAEVLRWNDQFTRRAALEPMLAMGQKWQSPNGPDGWEEGFDHWITPHALANRIDWAMKIPVRLRPDLPDARDFVGHALADLASDDLRLMVSRAERKAEGVGLVLASPQFNRR
ncbi:MAG: DUF1800 domain-containing protein [Gemmobacter sp.]|nr:DUF1800 domain-containing protein [Gemmobacter sp.]